MSEFSGRTVFVFGVAGALGSGLAEAFRGAGAQVVGFDRAGPLLATKEL